MKEKLLKLLKKWLWVELSNIGPKAVAKQLSELGLLIKDK